MLVLAFESSCDETSASVVEEGTEGQLFIRSNIIASQVETHKLYGGVVPEIASRAHVEAISSITREALSVAGVTEKDLDCVAVTTHPGLIGALLVAVNFAKAFAVRNRLPLVSVDHIKGHIAASYLTGDLPRPKPPFLALAVSGGHTALYRVEDYTEFTRVGGTRDDAIGEAFDKIGRIIGIPYPAGKEFDRLAGEGFMQVGGYSAFKKSDFYKDAFYKLPSPAIPGDNLDFSFSGLKTAAINLLHRQEQLGTEVPKELFCARFTYEAVEAVAMKTEMALNQGNYTALVVAGGVAANSHLRKRLGKLAKKKNLTLFIPPISLCGDNGAMIGAQGVYEYKKGLFQDSSLNASASDEPGNLMLVEK